MLEAEQWRKRAEKAEKELSDLRAMIFTNGDRSMTMKGRTFTVDDDGFICDQNFDFDACMKVSGDFCDGEKRQYAEMIAEALNKAASNNGIKGAAKQSPL
jgi:hypothetical protein